MIDRKQIGRNAVLTVVQVAVSAVTMFLVYRYLLKELGAEKMGVWSIVMAMSTVARLSDLGFAGGMTKYVAKYRALDDAAAVSEVIDTGALSIAGLFAVIGTILYVTAYLALPYLFTDESIGDARNILPYSLLSFGLMAVGGVYLSALDGFQRADKRNLILIGGTLVYASVIPLSFSQFGFVGLGYAQLLQTGLMAIAGWLLVRRAVNLRKWLPSHWKYVRFREMLGYNLNLQFATVTSFLGDPLTKIMLGQFGSLAMVGYYEMASKMVSQFRGLLVNVNQVLVPVIAHLNETDREKVGVIYTGTYSALLVITVTFYSLVAIAVPAISHFWLGSYNVFFVFVCYVMLGAMQINTMTGPAYFSNMGTGKVLHNSVAQSTIASTNIVLSLLLGWLWGGYGVVMAYALAIAFGSMYLLIQFVHSEGIPISSLLPVSQRSHVSLCLGLAVAASASYKVAQSFGIDVAKHIISLVSALLVCVSALRTEPLSGWVGAVLNRIRRA